MMTHRTLDEKISDGSAPIQRHGIPIFGACFPNALREGKRNTHLIEEHQDYRAYVRGFLEVRGDEAAGVIEDRRSYRLGHAGSICRKIARRSSFEYDHHLCTCTFSCAMGSLYALSRPITGGPELYVDGRQSCALLSQCSPSDSGPKGRDSGQNTSRAVLVDTASAEPYRWTATDVA